MKTWTVDEMLAEHPCEWYDRDRITALWAGRDALSLRDILDLDIRADERVWVACRLKALPVAIRRRWTEGIVERAVRTYALTCGVSAVERWAAQWLDGTDRTSESAAQAAGNAWSAAQAAQAGEAAGAAWAAGEAGAAGAAWSAAWEAAGAAWSARAAACAAESAAQAARGAARGAARAAAEAAARAAAEAAEQDQQIADLRTLLDKDGAS